MMRRKLSILLALLAVGLFSGETAEGASGNLLGNPDFELDDDSWDIWSWSRGEAAIESDLAIQLEGRYLRASRPGGGGAGAAQEFAAVEGDVFLIQGWVRTSEGATGECAVFTVSWGDANYVPSENNFLRRDESTVIGEPILIDTIPNWTLVKMVTLPAPAGTVTARFECFNNKNGDGDAYFDKMHVGRPWRAWGESPADGSRGVRPSVTLSWHPGVESVSHDIYFGTDYNDLEFVVNQGPNSYQTGVLELDTTYYWRIDEVNEPNVWPGKVWSFTVGAIKASWPSPADGEQEANRNSILSWAAGADANSHDVYFGTDFNDVNDATTGTSGIYQGNQPYGDNNFDPNVLEIERTYYWRIDEVNEFDPNIWKGDVWSFRVSKNLLVNPGFERGSNVEPWSEGIDPSPWFRWSWESGWVAWKSDSGQGNDPPLANSGDKFVGVGAWTDPPELWAAGAGLSQNMPVDVGDILTASVWARTELWGSPLGVLKVEFKDQVGGTVLQYDESYIINSVEPEYTQYNITTRPAPEGTTVGEFIVMATNQGTVLFDDAFLEFGPPKIAWNPRPIQGGVWVDRNADLSWNAGVDALSHDVYFGTDFNDVSAADNSWPKGGPDPADPDVYKGNQAIGNTSYELGLLAPSQSYYWRIDEVNGLDVWRGDIWRFRSNDHIVVDDFDSYADNTALTDVWEDGWYNETGSAATVDVLTFRDGNSLRFEYDNKWYEYSEVEAATADLGSGTNWRPMGTKSLSLWFYGQFDNDANEQMYVVLEDSGAEMAVVNYDGDMNDIRLEEWQEWNIALDEFTDGEPNLDLMNTAKVYIGFGDRYGTTTGGGAGDVWFEDIRLYPTRCVSAMSLLEGDFTGDCLVDGRDVEIMASDWLVRDYNVAAETLSAADLVGWYEFEGDANDSSGNDNDGALHGGASFVDGVDGNALDLDGFGDYMSITGSNIPGGAFDFNDVITVTAWIQVGAFDKWFQTVISKGDDSWRLARYEDQDRMEFSCTGVSGGFDPLYGNVFGSIKVDDGQWHHVAGVYDGSRIYLYVDGILDGSSEATGVMNNNTFNVYIGANEEATEREWNGLIDEVHIYNRGLSHGEILSLAGKSEVYQPVVSPANISDEELMLSKGVNFKDYAVVADNWLGTLLWP